MHLDASTGWLVTMKCAAYALVVSVACAPTEMARDAGLDASLAGDAPEDTGADGAPADTGTMRRTPIDIYGYRLVEWYDASDASSVGLDGGIVVAEWRDRSLWRERDMSSIHGSFGVRIDPIAANGHPAMRVGTQYGCFRTLSPPMLDDVLLVIVASFTNGIGQAGVLWEVEPIFDGVFVTVNIAGTTGVYAGLAQWPKGAQSTKVGLNDGQLHVFVLQGNGMQGSVRVRVDGVEDGADSGIGSGAGVPTWVGGIQPKDAGVQSAVEGYIAEILVVQSGTDVEFTQLAEYVGKKYALTL